MARAALAGKKIGQGPRPFAAYVPAASVVAASFLATMPIVATSGWIPDFGFLVLIAWRLLRADAFPAWWAAPLGLANDLLAGLPVGFSVTMWTASMLALDLADRRTMWRDYWIEWVLAALLLGAYELAQWRVAQIMGASLPIVSVLPPLVISVLSFPVAAWFVGRIDRWRVGR
jgi:rod shape-determining protein MreD